MSNRKIFIRGYTSCLVLALIFGSGALLQKYPAVIITTEPISATTQTLYTNIQEITSMIQMQSETDQHMLDEFNSGTYTQDEPLVIVNPYEISPLTAIVLFKSSEPVQVSVRIQGVDEASSVAYLYEDYSIDHILPIYGLYPGVVNTVTLTLINATTQKQVKILKIETDRLSTDLAMNQLSITKSNLPISPGFTFSYRNGFSSTAKTAFDLNGDYRWYLTKNYLTSGSYDLGRRLVLSLGDPYGPIILVEMNYLGKILKAYYSPYGNHHDIAVTDNRLIITGSNNSPNTIEDFVYAIDRSTGDVTQRLSYLGMLDRTRHYGYFYSNKDWMHMNSVIEYEGDLIVSSNHQSSIIRNDWDGNIKWILGDPTFYTTGLKRYVLKPIGKDFLYPYNQHAAEILPDTDGNPDTVDLLLFDNGYSRYIVDDQLQYQISAHLRSQPELFSRMVHYQINEKDMTVRQIWQYGQNRPELFAQTRGDANLLSNGNFLGSFFSDRTLNGITTQRSVYVEVDAAQRVVWECVATSSNFQNSYVEYKAERFEIYNSDTAVLNLRLRAQNFIPSDLLSKAGVNSALQRN
ncbi:MAG: aryl-sulfate sulfotransferase [Erysipelotrichaceae bacterium]|nr:aryl-sulfate sulfotransferase [Erysipelotrichaceae bacterium]